MKRLLSLVMVIAMLFSLSGIVSAESLSAKEIVIEEYELIEDLDNLREIAQENIPLPDGGQAISKINGQEIPTYIAVEKVRTTLDTSSNEEKTTYRVTVFSDVYDEYLEDDYDINTIIDPKERKDPSLSVTGYARAYYEGSLRDGYGYSYTRISKWEAKYARHDSQVSVDAVVFAKVFGPDYDENMWQGRIDFLEERVPIHSRDQWHSLLTSWRNAYIMESSLYGQLGGFFGTLTRGSYSWDHEVVLNYGT